MRVKTGKKQQEILEKALSLFIEKGFQKVTMSDIAKECGLARTSLYEYFASKNDILVQLVRPIVLKARKANILGDTAREKLEYSALNSLRVIKENRDIYYVAYQESANISDQTIVQDLSKVTELWTNEVAQILNEGIQTGEICSSYPLNQLIFAYQTFVNEKARQLLFVNKEMDIQEEVKWIITILFEGIQQK